MRQLLQRDFLSVYHFILIVLEVVSIRMPFIKSSVIESAITVIGTTQMTPEC